MPPRNLKTLTFTDADSGGIIHVANIKGGVGKSTVATNLAAALSRRGATLIIDLDVQGSATSALGLDPAQCETTSWQLLSRRCAGNLPRRRQFGLFAPIRHLIKMTERFLIRHILPHPPIQKIAVQVRPCLDIIPATSDLFRNIHFFHINNLIYNLKLCRLDYKYVIIDTPSVWNPLTQALFENSDLNLIPVTLSALSTRSLRNYLVSVKSLSLKNPRVHLRIVKNDVFGSAGSAIRGKTVTMNENRQFLEALCEQVVRRGGSGTSLIPQSIILDMEIPESATVRSAQDAGQTVEQVKQYSNVAKAFEDLARRVQYVLNSHADTTDLKKIEFWEDVGHHTMRVAALVLFVIILGYNRPTASIPPPRPIAPQQLTHDAARFFEHTFAPGESIYKIAKYAISHFKAVVPTQREIGAYAQEVMQIHNMTRLPGEAHIRGDATNGMTVRFYPPSMIQNDDEKGLVPVYDYFRTMTNDRYAYITGDWCERGSSGFTPHYGIDVAAIEGSTIITPEDGIAILKESSDAGRMVGIIKDGTVLAFCHMNSRFVANGEVVHAGQAVGTVGMTGHTTGPHVHIAYGIASQTNGIQFGRGSYRLTDPKLFFYREQYMKGFED